MKTILNSVFSESKAEENKIKRKTFLVRNEHVKAQRKKTKRNEMKETESTNSKR